jgi:hypothetical protein
VIKKTKVLRALKIHTPSDSEESPKPKETPAPDKENVVEKGQNTNINKDAPGPKETLSPQPEPMVEDPMATNQGKQDNVQDDGTILMHDAPNAEARDDALNDPGVEGKKV